MKKVIYNIGKLMGILPADVRMLAGEAMGHVECIDNAYLVIEDGIIADFGSMSPHFWTCLWPGPRIDIRASMVGTGGWQPWRRASAQGILPHLPLTPPHTERADRKRERGQETRPNFYSVFPVPYCLCMDYLKKGERSRFL